MKQVEVISIIVNGHPLVVADAKRVGLNGHRVRVRKLEAEEEATLQQKIKQNRSGGAKVPVVLEFSNDRRYDIEAHSDSFRFHDDLLTFEEIEPPIVAQKMKEQEEAAANA
ncbi:MAG TPA: hypothetical protein V6C76_18055 [Drouetiella sp.]